MTQNVVMVTALPEEPLETWRRVWRHGFVPLLARQDLEALRQALEEDDKRLIQGATTTPPPLPCVQDWPVEQACAVAWCGWQGQGLPTVEQVEEFFARLCGDADHLLGESAGCRWFLNWYDETPRNTMRRELLTEVELALQIKPVEPEHRVEDDKETLCIRGECDYPVSCYDCGCCRFHCGCGDDN